jgi:hypothetical protein
MLIVNFKDSGGKSRVPHIFLLIRCDPAMDPKNLFDDPVLVAWPEASTYKPWSFLARHGP